MLIYAILALALRSLIDWLAYRIGKIDAQREQEAADAKLEAAAQLRAQEIAAMNAATAAAPPSSTEPLPLPTTGPDPFAR